MMNQTILVGRLTKDPDLRYTSEGVPFCFITVAVPRDFRNQNGEIGTDFITVTLWRKSAESAAQRCQKGTLVGIKGRVQTRSYEKEQNQKTYVTEVVAEQIKFLSHTVSVNV
ncbi:single-stranded DNA-binding protein [Bacillus songklensis]|uniref:Single-stranded DNA-binding protein n=1 Tax=Bacillus songklensis TaxID=1069116 RepID=A0ABV8BBD9_9BACI